MKRKTRIVTGIVFAILLLGFQWRVNAFAGYVGLDGITYYSDKSIDMQFIETDDGIIITRYHVSWPHDIIVIPSMINNKSVVTIGEGAYFPFFRIKDPIKQIYIPESVTRIETKAFSGGDPEVEEIILPEFIEYIGANAFPKYEGIQISLPERNEYYFLQDDFLIERTTNTAIFWCGGKTTQPVVPDGVERLGRELFNWWENITQVTLPEGLTEIGASAFAGLKNLSTVQLPRSLEIIETIAFIGCENLREIRIPDGVHTIGQAAFHNCYSLKSISLPGSLKIIAKNAFSIDPLYNALRLGEGLQEVTLNEGLECIEANAFSGTGIKRVVIPKSVIYIDETAFDDGVELIFQ